MQDKKPTEKQIQIIQMVSDDRRQAEIAFKLDVSVRSVENEVKKIRQSWGIKSLPAICVFFYRNGWIS